MSTESKTIKELLAKLDPYQSVIGIDDNLDIYEGYDSPIYQAQLNADPIEDWRGTLTSNEKLLLAKEMIRRWTDYSDEITLAAGELGSEP